MSDIDIEATDRLLTTTKQVRKRLDLDRSVPIEILRERIEIANHAPMGGRPSSSPNGQEGSAPAGRPSISDRFRRGRTARPKGHRRADRATAGRLLHRGDVWPASRRDVAEITYLNGWKRPIQ